MCLRVRRLLPTVLLLAYPAMAAGVIATPGVPVGGDVSINTSVAAGGTAARTQSARASDTVNIMDFGAKGDGATDDSAALAAAIGVENSRMAMGSYPCVRVPDGYSILVGTGTPIPAFTPGKPGCVVGDGPDHSSISVSAAFSGRLFTVSEAWISNTPGASIRNIRLNGNLSATAEQDAVSLLDRNDNVFLENVDFWNWPGRAFYAGAELNQTQAYLRESMIRGVRIFNSGRAGTPAFELTSQNTSGTSSDATNDVQINQYRIYGSHGPSIVIRNSSATAMGGISFTDGIVEGTENGTTAADLVTIGDPTLTGQVTGVRFQGVSLLDPYGGYAAFRLTAPSKAASPYGITVDGGIGGGSMTAGAKGLEIDAAGGADGGANRFRFSNISTTGTNVTVGPSTLVNGRIFLDGDGLEGSWSYSVDPTTAGLITNTDGTRQGVPNATPATVANYHDGSPGGGAAAAAACVDLQQTRFAAVQTCQNPGGVIGGGANNTTAAQFAVVGGGNANTDAGFAGGILAGNNNTIISGSFHSILGGQYNSLSGYASTILGGQYATDRGRTGWTGWASGKIVNPGDAQTGAQLLRGSGATASAIRMTADGATANSANIDNITAGTHYHLRTTASCRDTTSAGWASWDDIFGDLDRTASGNASYAGGAATAVAPNRSGGTLTGMTLQISGDASNQGVNVSALPVSSNIDTIHCGSKVMNTEELQ